MSGTSVENLLTVVLTVSLIYLALFSFLHAFGVFKSEDVKVIEIKSKGKVKYIPCEDTSMNESYIIEEETNRYRSCEDYRYE